MVSLVVTWKVVHEYLRRHGGGGGSKSNLRGRERNGGSGSDVSTIPVSHILTRQADLAGPRGPSYVRSDLCSHNRLSCIYIIVLIL